MVKVVINATQVEVMLLFFRSRTSQYKNYSSRPWRGSLQSTRARLGLTWQTYISQLPVTITSKIARYIAMADAESLMKLPIPIDTIAELYPTIVLQRSIYLGCCDDFVNEYYVNSRKA